MSRWAKHPNSFYEEVFVGLGLPGGIQIAEVDAGGGEMLATIEHAKLHQSGTPWASWTWLGNVPAKATARVQNIKESIGKFGEKLLKQNEIEAHAISDTRATTLNVCAAKMPKSEDAFSTFNSIRITGHFSTVEGGHVAPSRRCRR